MVRALRSSFLFLFLLLLICALAAACGGGTTNSTFGDHDTADSGFGGDGTTPRDSGLIGEGGIINGDGSGSSSGGGGDSSAGFDVEPTTLQTVTVTLGMPIPTVVFTATEQGQPVTAGWSVDAGNLASITSGASSTGTVSPTGNAGGLVTVTAGRNGVTIQRQVFIQLVVKQNGPNGSPGEVAQIPTTVGQLTSGGGVGGVGGEGLGPSVSDPATLTALGSPTSNGSTQGLSFLYPYDGTVWPRGLLAPLLQWTWSTGDADAIEIRLTTTSGSFSYTGTFGRPAILMSETPPGKYIRAPIPQDVWTMATETAGGTTPNGMPDRLNVSLVVAKAGVGYGPILETWTVAPGLLDGTIYYQSYGTQLVQNYSGAVGGNGMFGGAVLSIHVGDTAPKVAAGTSATSPTGCRVCHAVASGGSRLVVVDGNNESLSSAYDLSMTPPTETIMAQLATYPAMYPDGSLALTNAGLLLPLPNATTATPTTGLTSVVTNLGEPAFSPDGTKIAFNPLAGST
jgi:hypothetical protein